MGLIIPTFADPLTLARLQREEEMAFAQNEYIDRKTQQSEKGERRVETVDGDLETVVTSMNWDYSEGWEQRRLKFVKGLRARRKKFQPSVRVRNPHTGQIQNVYEGDMLDLKWFEEGLCCVKCRNWKHEDAIEHIREHKRLAESVPQKPPAGVALKDLCAFCGSRLDMQKFGLEKAA
jgi:hypothetical protein